MKLFSSVRRINVGLVSSCMMGLALSYYAYGVETAKENDDSYQAMCDISEHISCTKAFMSDFGKGFGIIPNNSVFHQPNSLYGLGFYSTLAALSISNSIFSTATLVGLVILSNFTTIYLACILYLLRDFCVVCVSTYIVNAINLVLSLRKLRILTQGSSKKRKST